MDFLKKIKKYLEENKIITFTLMLVFLGIASGFIYILSGIEAKPPVPCDNLPVICDIKNNSRIHLMRISAVFLAFALGCFVFLIPKNILTFINNGFTSKTNLTKKEKVHICLRNIALTIILFITSIILDFQFMLKADDNSTLITIAASLFVVIFAFLIIGIMYSTKIFENNTIEENNTKPDNEQKN